MKKSKFILLTLALIVFLGFSLFFVPVRVMGIDLSDQWALPFSARNFVDRDGRGVRLYIYMIYDDVSDGQFSGDLNYAAMRAFKGYQLDDGEIETNISYIIGRNFFDSDLLDRIRQAGWSEARVISEQDRMYVYFDVERQVFAFEGYGSGYWEYWMERCFNLLDEVDESYDMGYNEGYDIGYQEGITVNHEAAYYEGYNTGYDVGYNVGYDEARPEMDILLITLIMFILSVFVYFKFRLRWVLIATVLLWFVPMFLVDNLFIRIFSVIMIIVTIVITFFNDREEEYLE